MHMKLGHQQRTEENEMNTTQQWQLAVGIVALLLFIFCFSTGRPLLAGINAAIAIFNFAQALA